MFDRTYIVPGRRSVHHSHDVRVTEKRAPTDESVRLLREMEAAANDRVLEAVRLTGNGFECVAQAMRDATTGDMILRAAFSLNGKKMTAEARGYNLRAYELVEKLVEAVAAKLAAEIVAAALRPLAAQLMRLR